MNQEKIGIFIAKIRKEKKLTQLDLANKLGVTDRAISKWENGRGMPDLSLLIPLCNELDISINELLSGEKLNKKDYQEKLEENIINTIDYSEKRIKKLKKIFKITFISILIIISLLISIFCIDINRMKKNEEVFFSTWGFDYTSPINLDTEEIILTIENYLVNQANKNNRYENEKTFISMETYLVEEKNKIYYIYSWVLEETYHLENGIIKKDSSSSIPHKFTVEKTNNNFKVIDSKIPRDGSYYAIDIKNIFPYSVRKKLDKVHKDGTIEKLQLNIKKQLNLYYHQ